MGSLKDKANLLANVVLNTPVSFNLSVDQLDEVTALRDLIEAKGLKVNQIGFWFHVKHPVAVALGADGTPHILEYIDNRLREITIKEFEG